MYRQQFLVQAEDVVPMAYVAGIYNLFQSYVSSMEAVYSTYIQTKCTDNTKIDLNYALLYILLQKQSQSLFRQSDR